MCVYIKAYMKLEKLEARKMQMIKADMARFMRRWRQCLMGTASHGWKQRQHRHRTAQASLFPSCTVLLWQ